MVFLKSYKKFLWKGRFDNVVNSGGIKLFPETIEVKLQQLISHRFFLIGIPDDSLGEKLIMIIEANYSKDLISSINEGLANITTLTRYEIPKEIYCLTQFVETATGKVQRNQTLQLIQNGERI
ncbi:hypothetical protein ACE939_05285 [Aquimarina sp. W85]|uniref:hypothetical protein n=1 Tax=Aquimarina rhodophyticola TaxID=3342246 RepID=UPI00366A8BFB